MTEEVWRCDNEECRVHEFVGENTCPCCKLEGEHVATIRT